MEYLFRIYPTLNFFFLSQTFVLFMWDFSGLMEVQTAVICFAEQDSCAAQCVQLAGSTPQYLQHRQFCPTTHQGLPSNSSTDLKFKSPGRPLCCYSSPNLKTSPRLLLSISEMMKGLWVREGDGNALEQNWRELLRAVGRARIFAAPCPQLTSHPSLTGRGSIFWKLLGFAALHFLGLVPVAHRMSWCGEEQISYKKFKKFL